jgi:hypothetical protein
VIAQAIFAEIESTIFSAKLGVVSTPDALTAAMLEQPAVAQLTETATLLTDAKHIAARAIDLIQQQFDPQYCHPHDLAVAVYLRVLDICAPDEASRPAQVALTVANSWWARLMALRIAASPNRTIPVVTMKVVTPFAGLAVTRYATTLKGKPTPPKELTLCTKAGTVEVQNSFVNEQSSQVVRSQARIRNYSVAAEA